MAFQPKSDLDALSRLIWPKWRGVQFSCGQSTMALSHDLAEHKFPDRPGGIIENTGRNPMRFTFQALFRNGVAGPEATSLQEYPDNFRLFMAACADGTTGELVHPEYGPVKAKCVKADVTYDPAKRDGVDVAVEFIEAPLDEAELDDLLGQPSPMGQAITSALDLDNATGDIDPIPEYPDAISPSALESMKALSGAFQQFKLGLGNVAGLIDSYLGAFLELRDTLVGNGNPATTVKAILAIDQIIDALMRVAQDVAPKNKPVVQVTVSAEATADTVAGFFSMALDDFLRMNPVVGEKPRVPAGTPVFVYA